MNHSPSISSWPLFFKLPEGESLIPRQSLQVALAIIASLATLYYAFGYRSRHQPPCLIPLTGPKEASYQTKRLRRAKVLTMITPKSDPITSLGTSLEGARKTLSIEALNNPKTGAKRYAELANLLLLKERNLNASIELKVKDQFISLESLYLLALILHPFEAAVERGIWTLSQQVSCDKKSELLASMKKQLLKNLTLKPVDGRLFCILSLLLASQEESIRCTIHEREELMNQKQLLEKAISLAPHYPYAYTILADLLEPEETLQMSGSEEVWNQKTLYLKALDCDPSEKAAFLGLVDALVAQNSDYLSEEGTPTRALYEHILELNPSIALARQALAVMTPPDSLDLLHN